MSFGTLLGQLLQNGMGGQSQTRDRIDASARNLGAGDGGGRADNILASLQGALGGAGGGGAGFGGMAEKARQFLGQEQVGRLSGAQVGGIGAAAGALLGGGIGGAAKGGALAVLGTLALTAYKNAQAKKAAVSPDDQTLTLEPQEIAAVTGPDTEKLLLRAMISAAKADGQIDRTEMQKIIGKVSGDDVTPEEKAYVMDEMNAPLDVAGLAAQVKSPEQAAEVYAVSLLAIDIDSEDERGYLRDLAGALRLDAETVAELHRMTGAPTV